MNQIRHRIVFFPRGDIDFVIRIPPRHRQIGGDFHHIELIDFGEFIGLGHRRAGHAGQFGIEAEIILEGDGSERLVFRLNFDPLFRLQRLMETIGIAAAIHHTASEFVDNHDFAATHDIFHVTLEQGVGPQGLLNVMHHSDVVDVVKTAIVQNPGLVQHLLDIVGTLLGQDDAAELSSFS